MPLPSRLASLPVRALACGLVVREAATRRARLVGLAWLPAPREPVALWLPRCRSVHTFGMRFALDLVWLDARGRVVRVDRDVGRRRVRFCRRAASVVELPVGQLQEVAAGAVGPEGRPRAADAHARRAAAD